MRRFLLPAALIVIATLAATALVLSTRTASDAAPDPRVAPLTQRVEKAEKLAGEQAAALEAQGASLARLQKLTSEQGARLAKICGDKQVASMRASLLGELSAYDSPDYSYFSNLNGVIDAACGSEWEGEGTP